MPAGVQVYVTLLPDIRKLPKLLLRWPSVNPSCLSVSRVSAFFAGVSIGAIVSGSSALGLITCRQKADAYSSAAASG